MQEIPFDSWVGKILWRRDRLPTPVFLGFPCGSAGKESACNVGDLDSVPGLGRFPAEGKGYPHISILPGEFPWLYGSWGRKEVEPTEWLLFSFIFLAQLPLGCPPAPTFGFSLYFLLLDSASSEGLAVDCPWMISESAITWITTNGFYGSIPHCCLCSYCCISSSRWEMEVLGWQGLCCGPHLRPCPLSPTPGSLERLPWIFFFSL